MAETPYDSSSDLGSSDILEGTPVKEDCNVTLLMGPLTSKQTHPHNSLSHSAARYRGNKSKLGILRSSSSLQADVSSDEDSDEFTADRRRHRRCTIESTDSETSQSGGDSLLETSEELLYSEKPTLKVGKHRQIGSVISISDSEEALTDEAEGLVVSDSPELLKPLPAKSNDKKKKFTFYSSDSDVSNTPGKSVTVGKYRNRKFVESSDSETSSFNEGSPSASDSSSPVTMLDKNAVVGTELSEAESSNADGQPVQTKEGTSKQTVEANQLNSVEQSLQALTVWKREGPTVAPAEIQSLIPQKKELLSEIVELTHQIYSLKSTIRSSSLSSLPDRGTRLQMSLTEKETKLKQLKEQWQSTYFDAVPDSSDSETSSFSEESPSVSDSSSPVTVPDKNVAVGTELKEAESSNADGRPVLETSTSRTCTVEHKGFKSPIQNCLEVCDAMEKTVEDEDNGSAVQTKEFLHSEKQSVNCQSDLKHVIPSSILGTSKQTVEANQLNSLEQSLQAVTVSKREGPTVAAVDNRSLIVQKKGLQTEIAELTKGIDNLKIIIRSSNLSSLPDHGTRLQMSLTEKETKLKQLKEQWQSSNFDAVPDSAGAVPKKAGYLGSMPSTVGMGQRALQTYRAEKAMTVDTLKHLHGSLKTCPQESVLAEDPLNLKSTVKLMPHQKHALAWLLWRERNKPNGGILADDMGLGKTLTMIALVLKSKEETENNNVCEEDADDTDDESPWCSKKRTYEKGGTLVICPASLLNQWEGEVNKRVKRGVIDLEVYHGTSRESRPRRLARRDMIVTTYHIVRSEGGVVSGQKRSCSAVNHSKQGTLFGVKWERVILDEAHTIRNHKCQTAVAVCALKAKYRWALTGTPFHNKELDLYSLLKFLRCSPFDDLVVWRRWISDKSAGGIERLTTVMNSVMLRRTKEQLQSKGNSLCLPERHVYDINVKLDEEESRVYQTILNFSRTLFAQFLSQKIEKEQLVEAKSGHSKNPTYLQNEKPQPYDMNDEIRALHQKMRSMGDVKTFHMLVLLLRLRQICCHPGLIESMIDKESCENDGIEDETGLDVDLLSQFEKMVLRDKKEREQVDADALVKKKVLVQDNPVFKKDRISSKMHALFNELGKVMGKGDNIIIVSQFTSMLELVHKHLKEKRVKCLVLTGSVPVKERNALVEQFNGSSGSLVMLLSLSAGGVGLNLIGGNHMFLIDPHWNPQLEAQACDRIYRVGQTKSVHIYKFVTEETIEQQIKSLQVRKLGLASSVLTGTKHHGGNKLTLDDLKILFNFNAPASVA